MNVFMTTISSSIFTAGILYIFRINSRYASATTFNHLLVSPSHISFIFLIDICKHQTRIHTWTQTHLLFYHLYLPWASLHQQSFCLYACKRTVNFHTSLISIVFPFPVNVYLNLSIHPSIFMFSIIWVTAVIMLSIGKTTRHYRKQFHIIKPW